MTKTTEQLLEQAVLIRDEQADKKNTALRVGSLFLDIIQKQDEDVTALDSSVKDNERKLSELETNKLSISDLAQSTGGSTITPMSQDATTKALSGLLPNQRADNTPYISVTINDGDSGQNWETFNRKLDEIASMSDPMPYNGDIRYFISEGLRVDVTNRIFDSSEGASRRLTQVVTGNVRLDDRLDLALAGDIDQSFWRIYKEGAWSEWKAVNAGGGSGSVDVVQETGSSTTAVMSQNAVTNEFTKIEERCDKIEDTITDLNDMVVQNKEEADVKLAELDNFYFTTLDVVSIDDGANVSAEEFDEIIRIQDAIKSQKTIISSIGILASSVGYRRPLYTVSISYIIGNELRMMTAKTPLSGGGTWSVKSQDLSNLANNGYNVLIHGEYAHGEGVSSKLAYEGSTIPSDVQQVMMEWYMSPDGYSIAYGPGSHVEGQDCLATGDYAHAEGIKTLAANNGAHAEGTGTNAAGTYAHAEGQSTTAYATACHAEGGMSVCNGNYGHVEGFRCTVENTAGHAEGYITYCRANYGHVEGRQTNSIGPCAHAEGYGNKIDRSITITSISNVEGYTSYFKADNISDLKIGACFIIDYIPYVVTNIADGNVYVNRWIEFKQQKYDIIIMYGAAYGNNAHAEGELGSAIGNNSHVSGASCIAFNNNEVACGHYNYSFWSDDNAKRTLYSIGIGESDSNRKNAYELKENGDLYIYGVGGYTGKNSSEAKTIQKVITEQQQGGSGGGIEDAPSDGKTYGRKDGTWNEVEGITELSFDRPHSEIMSYELDSITTPGVYKIKSPNYYCEGYLEVIDVNMADGYERLLKQILRISEKGDGGGGLSLTGAVADIPYAYRYRFASSISSWTDWAKPDNSEVNLGELAISNIDEPFPSEFFYMQTPGTYTFSLMNNLGSGTLNIVRVKVNDDRGSRYLVKQIVQVDVSEHNTDAMHVNVNLFYAVRFNIDTGYGTPEWTIWRKTKTPLT